MNKKQKITFFKEFGLNLTFKTFYFNLKIKLTKKNKNLYSQKLNEVKLKWLNNKYGNYVDELVCNYNKEYKKENINPKIWQFWMQGNQDNIPIVKMCLDSINNTKPSNVERIIITKDNLKKYAKISDNIYKKFDNNLISITHLSDILRMNLLYNYGGIWLDATIYSSNKFDAVFNNNFWTIKRKAEDIAYIPKGKWTGYAIGGVKDNLIFYLMNNLFEKYWEEYDVLIDFFLIDLFLELLYRRVPQVKKYIDKVNYNNINVHELWQLLSIEYTEEKWKKIIRNTDFFKLSWRIKQQEVKNGNKTYFGMLMERNKD